MNIIKRFKNYVGKALSPNPGWVSRPAMSSQGRPIVNDSVWVIGGIEAIAQSLSSRPLLFVNGKNEIVGDGRLSGEQRNWVSLFAKPHPLTTSTQLWEKTSMLYDIAGSCFWALMMFDGSFIANRFDVPEMLMVLPPSRVKPRYLSEERKDMVVGWWYILPSGAKKAVEFWQVLRFYKTNPDSDVDGLAITNKIGSTIELDVMAKRANRSFLRNGGRPSGVIHETKAHQGTKELETVGRTMEEGYTSPENAGKIPVIPQGYEWKADASARDMDYEKMSRMNRDEEFGATRVPKHMMGINDDLNFATAQISDSAYWHNVIKPRADYFASVVNEGLLVGVGIKCLFSFIGISALETEKQELFDKKLRSATRLYNLGYSINEICRKLDLGMDEIKEKWASLAHDPLLEIGKRVPSVSETGAVKALEISQRPFDDALKVFADLVRTKEQKDDWELAYEGDEDAMDRVAKAIEDVTTEPLIAPFQKVIESYFRRLSESQVKRLQAFYAGQEYQSKAEGDAAKRVLQETAIAAVLFNVEKWDSILRQDALPYHRKAYVASIKQVSKELDGFSLFSQSDAQAALEIEKINVEIVGINQRLRERLREKLSELVKQGAGNAEIIESVQHEIGVDLKRANTIARTETGMASSKARYDVLSVEVKTKRWLTAKDSVVRATHRHYGALGSQDMSYEYAPHLHYPREQGADAGEVINCRCVLVAGSRKTKPKA